MGCSTEGPLTAQDRRVETAEYAAMMRRMLRGWERRLADSDVPDLAELAAFPAKVAECQDRVVQAWRANGRSWSEIAAAFGISRQGAQQRWGHSPAP